MNIKLNYGLLSIKAYFFIYFAALAPILPFLPIYAKQLGIDALGVGVVFAVLPFIGMIVKPIAGWIADRFDKHKLVFLLSIFLTGAGYFCLQFIPGVDPDRSSHIHCSNPLSLLTSCGSQEDWTNLLPRLTDTCPVTCEVTCTLPSQARTRFCSAFGLTNCSDDTVQFSIKSNLSLHDVQDNTGCLYLPIDSAWTDNEEYVVKPTCMEKSVIDCQAHCQDEHIDKFIRKDSVFASSMFWTFFLLNIIAYSSMCVANSMGDAICFTQLGDKPENYGSQRVWGSIGWGLFTIIAGYLVDSQSESSDKNYTPAFFLLGGLLLLNLLVTGLTLKIVDTGKSNLVMKDIFRLCSQIRVIIFVIWCILCGFLTSLIWHFLPWYLSDLATTSSAASVTSNDTCEDGGQQGPEWMTLLLGLNIGIQCFVGEVPMFFLSGWIISKLGHSNTMTLVLGAFGARLLLYSFLTNPWYSLLVEVLNGVTFGIFYTTMTSYAHIISPKGFESTMQGLVGAAFEGLGVAAGALLGGVVFDRFGGLVLFRWSGGVALGACVLHGIIQLVLPRSQDKQESQNSHNPEEGKFLS